MTPYFTAFVLAALATTDMAVAQGPTVPKLPACPASDLIGEGDAVKVYLFELTTTRDDEWAKSRQPQPATANFALRSELSGVLNVGADGFLFLPLLGSIKAAQLAPDALASAIGAKFKDTFGHDATVNLFISARRPIFIVGYVKNPGRYEFMQGMTLMHAVALAGGALRSTLPSDSLDEGRPKYAIARAHREGAPVQADAEALSPLCPGDLVRILRPDR